MIDGNICATVLQYNAANKNEIGEAIPMWEETGLAFYGWLDLISADSGYEKMKTIIQDSTHVFVMDYENVSLGSKNNRLAIRNHLYDIIYVDDPMELHEHLEIYLRYVGEEYVC